MDWISRKFKAGFQEIKQRTSVGVTHLEDVGALVDDNLFERDILIATKRLASLSNIAERTQAVKDLGHLSWSGGPSAAKFAGNQLVNLLSVLNNPDEPAALKMLFQERLSVRSAHDNPDRETPAENCEIVFLTLCGLDLLRKNFTVQAISEICCANKENQDKARCYGLIDKLTEILSTSEPDLSALRRSSAACLLTLACENLENQKTLLRTDKLQVRQILVSVARGVNIS